MRIPRRQLQPFTHRWPAGHPPLWIVLIAANVGFFLVQKLVDASQPDLAESYAALTGAAISHGYVWQFVTSTFLHLNVMHLLTNMVLLFFAGRELEALVGPRHFLSVYFGGGILGGLVQLMVGLPESPTHAYTGMIGASACVLAVVIAFTTILPELELNCLLFLVIPVRLRAKTLAFGIVSVTVFFILIPYMRQLTHIASVNHVLWVIGNNPVTAHYAHLGGCLFGWLYVKQLGYGNPWLIQKYFFDRRQQAERLEHMSSAQFITEQIDPILEKISRDGIQSLSRSERRILQMGRDKIEKGLH